MKKKSKFAISYWLRFGSYQNKVYLCNVFFIVLDF